MSPIKGLWEVTINDRGKRGVLYVDFSKQFVLPGPIIEVKTGANKTQEMLGKIQEKKKVDFSKIPLPSPLVLGNPRAAQRVAVFTDPDCPFCGKLHVELEKIVQERSDIAFHILLFPLAMHKDAYWKSKSIVCNRSLKMLEEAFAQRPIPGRSATRKRLTTTSASRKRWEFPARPPWSPRTDGFTSGFCRPSRSWISSRATLNPEGAGAENADAGSLFSSPGYPSLPALFPPLSGSVVRYLENEIIGTLWTLKKPSNPPSYP